MRFTFLLISLIILSCRQNSKNQEKTIDRNYHVTGFSLQLYQKLIEYQKQFPIEKTKRRGGLYIYEIIFFQHKRDTFIQLSLSPDGYIIDSNELILGVFTGNSLYPTIVKNSKGRFSESFVNPYFADTNLLKNYRRIPGKDYPEVFPPLYKYKVQDGNMFLKSVDSVWLKW